MRVYFLWQWGGWRQNKSKGDINDSVADAVGDAFVVMMMSSTSIAGLFAGREGSAATFFLRQQLFLWQPARRGGEEVDHDD